MAAGERGWARSGDLDIAYEVHGDGDIDLVQVPGLLNTLEGAARHRPLAQFDEELARFARLIKLDRRGTGLSDRLPTGVVPTIEERIDDVRAVMDEVGSARACVMGTADGGPVALVFAATYPERVGSLVLAYTGPRVRWAPDYPWGATDDELARFDALVSKGWGTGVMADAFGARSDDERRQIAYLERLSGTPATATAASRANWDVDVRGALSAVSAPTLIVHYDEFLVWPVEGARYLTEHIADARIVELPGQPDNIAGSDADGSVPVIEEFVTGVRPEPLADRVLKTVLFTDIVRSTEHAARLGDRRWRELLDAHDAAIRRALGRFLGDEVNTTGDGFFAAFDGPARAIRCAQAIATDSRALGLEVRAGIHTGECERRGDNLAGIAVHIGARVSALAGAGEVLVTGTVRDLVSGSGIEFSERGRHALKGVPGEWPLLAVDA